MKRSSGQRGMDAKAEPKREKGLCAQRRKKTLQDNKNAPSTRFLFDDSPARAAARSTLDWTVLRAEGSTATGASCARPVFLLFGAGPSEVDAPAAAVSFSAAIFAVQAFFFVTAALFGARALRVVVDGPASGFAISACARFFAAREGMTRVGPGRASEVAAAESVVVVDAASAMALRDMAGELDRLGG
jgi:hypothetical protein